MEIFREHQVLIGDCDDSATFAGALVLAIGAYGCFVAIRQAGAFEFSHVWLRAAYDPGSLASPAAFDIDTVTPAALLPIRNYAESMVVYL
jgi:hypothetical protein